VVNSCLEREILARLGLTRTRDQDSRKDSEDAAGRYGRAGDIVIDAMDDEEIVSQAARASTGRLPGLGRTPGQ
jgi:hypothetical protein